MAKCCLDHVSVNSCRFVGVEHSLYRWNRINTQYPNAAFIRKAVNLSVWSRIIFIKKHKQNDCGCCVTKQLAACGILCAKWTEIIFIINNSTHVFYIYILVVCLKFEAWVISILNVATVNCHSNIIMSCIKAMLCLFMYSYSVLRCRFTVIL